MPMPVRLDAEHQAKVDAAWDNAMAPPDRASRQTLLDALLGSQAYQVGVDTLSFRSEKRCASGVVVMEIHYDRLAPEHDTFTFTLQDHGGKVVRRETFHRETIEVAHHELFIESSQLEQRSKQSMLAPAECVRLSALRERMHAAGELFPKFHADEPQE